MRIRLETWSGLWLSAALWAVNMEIGQLTPRFDCVRQIRLSAGISLAFTLLAIAAGWVSWRRSRAEPMGFSSPDTVRFDAGLSALAALIFAFALALQTAASLVLTGCER